VGAENWLKRMEINSELRNETESPDGAEIM
jgi:hypothetical protein